MGSPGTPEVVLVPTTGSGSLAAYSQALARTLPLRCVAVPGCSGSFGRAPLGRYALARLADDARALWRLRRSSAGLLHLTSHHLARYGPATRIPYVVTVHDLIRHRDWEERDRRPPLIHRPNVRDGAYLRLDAAGLRRAAGLIAVSEHTKREVVERLGVPPGRVHVVREAVRSSVFRPTDRRLLDRPYVLYVGSEQPRKNLETLLRAFAAVAGDELALVKVGGAGGPEAPFRARTLEQARAAGVEDRLVFAERVTVEDLVAWYSGAVCLVLPSRHEGFGLPPLEAMSCGCPAVVSAAGALPEVAGEGGIVYGRPDDADALAAALRRLLESPGERERVAAAGRRVAARFTWERVAADTMAVYRRVLASLARPQAAAGDHWVIGRSAGSPSSSMSTRSLKKATRPRTSAASWRGSS